MSKWEMVRLGDVCLVIAGQSPEGKYYNEDKKGVPFFQGKADFTETFPKIRYYTQKVTKEAVPGDILISVRAPVGPTNVCNVKCCIGRGLAAIRAGALMDSTYILYWLKSMEPILANMGSGSTFAAITTQVLKDIIIPLPPLATQQKIAAILDKADTLRRKDKALLAKYDELAQAIFVDMFGDPVRNEKRWEVRRLGEVCDSRLGKMLDKGKFNGEALYPYLGNSNVKWFEFNLSNLQKMEFSSKDRITFKLKRGDVIACEGGEVGRCAVWVDDKEEIYFQKALHRIRLNESKIDSYFFCYQFREMAKRNGFKDYTSSSTIAHLTGEKLSQVPIVLPPLSAQQRFRDAFLKTQNLVLVKEKISSETLFQSLLQRAFRGELVK